MSGSHEIVFASAHPKRPTAVELRSLYGPDIAFEAEVARPLYRSLENAARVGPTLKVPCNQALFKDHTVWIQWTRPNGMPCSMCIIDETMLTFLKKHFNDMSVTLDKAEGTVVFDWSAPVTTTPGDDPIPA